MRAEGEPIPVGGCVPLTGWAAADGLSFKSGLELACEEINMMGGILGRPLTPVFEDSKEQGADNIIPAMLRLIDRHEVHAIINGYNTGAVTAEYDTIADAGVPYLHHNTDIVHHETVGNDPETYFSNFMADPAEYWYGEGFMKFISDLNDTGKWEAPNKKVAIVTGSQNYSVVIANAMRDFGGEVRLGDQPLRDRGSADLRMGADAAEDPQRPAGGHRDHPLGAAGSRAVHDAVRAQPDQQPGLHAVRSRCSRPSARSARRPPTGCSSPP